MVKKRELSLCAIIVAICFVVSQSLSVYAVTNSTLTSQQLGTIFDGVESIVVQLDGIGLSEADISELFQLTPRENGFLCTNIYADNSVYGNICGRNSRRATNVCVQ